MAKLVFQFHYGMIGRHWAGVKVVICRSFNSTMGWLEGIFQIRLSCKNNRFNSTMGWLEDISNHFLPCRNNSFNSTMGWLEALSTSSALVASAVSIPLWDDWKEKDDQLAAIRKRFQFHYGMIGRSRIWTLFPMLACFNSTMGWLEDQRYTVYFW